MEIPYVNLAAEHAGSKDKLLEAVGGVIDHGQFILGPEVAEFERRFADLCQVRYAVGLNSGTDALVLALKVLGVGPGDEVITAPNSFVASASCIALLGAKPVFVDVGDDYNMDPVLIEAAITSKTRAIIPVHLTGRPADMDPILEISQRNGIHVVEDAAQAVGAEYKGRRVGSLGAIGCFSLHPLKTLNACGDGGVVTTNDSELYKKLKLQMNHGLLTRDECVEWGYNSRLDTIQAAILLVQLEHFEKSTEGRRAVAKRYQQLLEGLPQVRVPVDMPYERAVYHTFVVQAKRRDELKIFLAENGIGTGIHYPIPIHLQKAAAYLGYQRGDFPVTEDQAGKILSLPVYPNLRPSQIERVVRCLKSFYEGHDR